MALALQFAALVAATALLFIAGLTIHLLVVIGNIVDQIKGRPLGPTDQIITSLGISRIIFLSGCLDHTLTLEVKKAVALGIVSRFIRLASNYSSMWFLTLLSVVLCLKISNFQNSFFQSLRAIISRRVLHLIAGSAFISVNQAMLIVWLSNAKVAGNTTDYDVPLYILGFGHKKVQLFFILNITPLFIYLTAAVPLVISLSLHVHKMKRTETGQLDAYYRAMLVLIISFLSCVLHVYTSIEPSSYSTLCSIAWVYVVLNILPILHAIFLICMVKRLKNRFSWLFKQTQKILFCRQGSGTNSRNSMDP